MRAPADCHRHLYCVVHQHSPSLFAGGVALTQDRPMYPFLMLRTVDVVLARPLEG